MKKTNPFRIGTRGSKLALYQANKVKSEVENRFPDLQAELVVIKTKGDKILDVSLSKIGGKGLFTKELEVALLMDEIDVAVHSLKDLPTFFPDGLKLGGVLKRAEVRDALISRNHKTLKQLTSNDTIATSSLRRKAQLLAYNPNLKIIDIRGNVDTRLQKMESGHCDAMIMASAGFQRLGLEDKITEIIDPEIIVPAVSQGAIGLETRENDPEVEKIVNAISDSQTMIVTKAERAFLRSIEGGCQIPVGAYSEIKEDEYIITGIVASLDGSTVLKHTAKGSVSEAQQLALQVSKSLLDQGAAKILEEIRSGN